MSKAGPGQAAFSVRPCFSAAMISLFRLLTIMRGAPAARDHANQVPALVALQAGLAGGGDVGPVRVALLRGKGDEP